MERKKKQTRTRVSGFVETNLDELTRQQREYVKERFAELFLCVFEETEYCKK